MQPEALTAAILVGGRARRLDGVAKSALTVGRQTILDRQLQAIGRAGFRDVLLVGPWRHAAGAPGRHVPDVIGEAGSLGGVYSALLWATTEAVVVLAGDMPFVTPALLSHLGALGDHDAVVPRSEDRGHPLCAGYRRHVAPAIKRRLDRAAFRVSEALDDMRVRYVEADELAGIGLDPMVLMNVNTPDDYRRAERAARRHS